MTLALLFLGVVFISVAFVSGERHPLGGCIADELAATLLPWRISAYAVGVAFIVLTVILVLLR